MNPSGRAPACPPRLPSPVRRCVSRREPRPQGAANDPVDNVGSVIRFYFPEHGTGSEADDGTEIATRALALSLEQFISPEGRPARRDEIADRIAFLSCMFEDILFIAPPGV